MDQSRRELQAAHEVGQCRLTVSKPEMKACLVSAIGTKSDEPLSNSAVKFNLRHYNEEQQAAQAAAVTASAAPGAAHEAAAAWQQHIATRAALQAGAHTRPLLSST